MISQILSLSALSGTRAALTLLGLAVAANYGYVELPSSLAILHEQGAIVILILLAIYEETQEGDEDLQELTELLSVGTRAVAGGLAAYGTSAAADVEVTSAISTVGGAVTAVGVNHVRSRLHESLRGVGDSMLSPRTWLLWIERGGIIGLLAASFLAPVLALVLIVLAVIAAAWITSTKRRYEKRHMRRACTSCGFSARLEASLCPNCKAQLEVQKSLRLKE